MSKKAPKAEALTVKPPILASQMPVNTLHASPAHFDLRDGP
ncbi:hypothetical protein [Salinisphaera sp.]|nr:hypothetical protein [Salinisphaera sp.]HET7313256.1 hypothetical protein [Salinisphaera sp.]